MQTGRNQQSGTVLSDYLRALDPADAAPAQAPPDALFDGFWRAFRAVVRQEVRRRGLGGAPPRFLGIDGDHWDRHTLEELTTDCYVYLLARLRALKAQLRVKPHVDGLVRLNVRHCLHERQKAGDPLGYRVFEVFHEAVRLALEQGWLAGPGEEDVLDNDSWLTVGPGSETSAGDAGGGLGAMAVLDQVQLSRDQLSPTLRRCCDELLPELIIARGGRRRRVVEALSRQFARLGAADEAASTPGTVSRFRFKDLLDAAKSAVRWRWRELWLNEQGDGARRGAVDEDAAEPVERRADHRADHRADRRAERRAVAAWLPILHPRSDYEERQAFLRLTDCVDRGVRAGSASDANGHLSTLWQFLRRQAPDVEVLPSRRKVAAFLGLPRYRLPELYDRLAELVEGCRRALAGDLGEAEAGEERS